MGAQVNAYALKLDKADSDAGWDVESMDTLNGPTELYIDDGETSACVCLGGTHWRLVK